MAVQSPNFVNNPMFTNPVQVQPSLMLTPPPIPPYINPYDINNEVLNLKKQDYGKYKTQSFEQYNRGNLPLAIIYLEKAQKLGEEDYLTDIKENELNTVTLGRFYKEYGQFDIAIDTFEKSKKYSLPPADLKKDFCPVNLDIAECHQLKGDYVKAENLIWDEYLKFEDKLSFYKDKGRNSFNPYDKNIFAEGNKILNSFEKLYSQMNRQDLVVRVQQRKQELSSNDINSVVVGKKF